MQTQQSTKWSLNQVNQKGSVQENWCKYPDKLGKNIHKNHQRNQVVEDIEEERYLLEWWGGRSI